MDPDEFAEKMREIFEEDGDPEASHATADRVIVDLLVDLGYHEGARVFLDATKYYG